MFVIPFKIIEKGVLFATLPLLGTTKEICVPVVLIDPIVTPLKVPPVIVLTVNPAGKVIVTVAPTAMALPVELALNV